MNISCARFSCARFGAVLALGFALPTIATPSFAQVGGRAQALQQCSAAEQKFSQQTWGTQEIQLYRSCMAQHGQPE